MFVKAIRKHGTKEFSREILFMSWCSRRELLDVEESILIDLDVRSDRKSYNTKNKGIGQDPEVTRKIFLGKKQSPEQIAKRRKVILEEGTFLGEKNGRAQSVVCLGTGQIYPFAREAAKETGGHEVGISESCVKGSKHRDTWWMFAKEWEALGKPVDHPRVHTQWMVVRLTDGKIFDDAGEAAAEHRVSSASISLACSSSHRGSAGHHWMKYDQWIAEGRKLKPYAPYDRSGGVIVDSTSGKQYASATACSQDVGLSDISIMRQAKGITKQRRFFFLEEWLQSNGIPLTQENKRAQKRIVRIDTGEKFESISAAAKSVGGGATGLSQALHGSRPYKGVMFEILY